MAKDKATDEEKKDPEEVPVEQENEKPHEGLTPREAQLAAMLEATNARLARLEASADTNKLRQFDRGQMDNTIKTGFLRSVDGVDPMISWRCTKNEAFIDPKTGGLMEDQRVEYKTLSGETKEITLPQFNLLVRQVPIRMLSIDHLRGVAKVQMSKDGGQTYDGDPIDVEIRFIN